MRNIRANIAQAKMNENASTVFIIEILILSIVLGVLTSSWWVFGISLIGLMVLFTIKIFALILGVLFSIGWAVIAYLLGTYIFEEMSAGIVIALIVANVNRNISHIG